MKFKSNVELEALSNATTDTDRFIVSDSNTLKGAIYFADGTTGSEQYRGGIGYTHSTDKLFLVSGGQTRAWMDTNGNVGIGTDSRVFKL
jgi:hypothetical protein